MDFHAGSELIVRFFVPLSDNNINSKGAKGLFPKLTAISELKKLFLSGL